MISKSKKSRRCHPTRLARVLAAVLWVAAAGLGPRDTDAQTSPSVRVVSDASGERIQVDGTDFMVFGMNWDVSPTGENYLYDFWGQPDDIITEMLEREMPLLKDMGVNAIRTSHNPPAPEFLDLCDRMGFLVMAEAFDEWTIGKVPDGYHEYNERAPAS